MSEAVIRLPKYHQGQKLVVASTARFKTLSFGRRAGKSTLANSLLIDSKMGALNGYPVALFAPSYKLLDQSFRDIKAILKPVISRADNSQKRIELITKGSIDFFTLQDEDAGRSRRFSLICADEIAHCKNFEPIWQKSIRATLTDYKGSAWFLSSPNGNNYFRTGLFDRGDPTHKIYDPEWQSWQMPTSINPHIDPSEIAAAKKELPEMVFAQEFLGAFCSVEGALLRPSYIQEGVPPVGVALKTVVGVDLAISTKDSADFTVLLVLSQCPKGNLYVREVTRIKAQFNEILIEIKRVAAKWNPSVIGIEQVAFQTAIIQELLRTTQLNCRGIVPTTDKVTRFQPLVARYENGQVFHDPKLDPEFEKELLVFPMSKKSPDQIDAFSMAFKSLSYTNPAPLSMQISSL